MGGGGAIMEIPYLALTEDFQRSEIFDLTRFPVSDGAGVKCCTFVRYLTENIFDESTCELFDESMEMSGIEFLFDWKPSRTAARLPCGLKSSLKVGNN